MAIEGDYHNQSILEKIFDFDEEKNQFTKKAQRYQYIIQFLSKDDKNNSYKITDIQDEILQKATDLFNIDRTKKPSDIKKNTNRQFNKYLDELEEWNLVKSEDVKSSKAVDTKVYQLSKFGKILSLMIDSLLSENKKDKSDKMYEYWKVYLSDYSSSIDSFCMSHLHKCKEEGLFEEVAQFFINNLVHYNQNIRNIIDLFTQMILVRFNDKQKDSILYNLWKRSFDELDEPTQKLFSNHMKIHLNRMILRIIRDYNKYELKRFEIRDKHDLIVAESFCKKCPNSFQYIAINVISYVLHAFNKEDKTIDEYLTNLKCEQCKENGFEIIMAI
jgi:hypothetical protein